MGRVMVKMDLVDNKAKIYWIYLRKIVFGTIREDQVLVYIT